jgi:hypothetical protein
LQTMLEMPCMWKLGFSLFSALFLESIACGCTYFWPCITPTLFCSLVDSFMYSAVHEQYWVNYPPTEHFGSRVAKFWSQSFSLQSNAGCLAFFLGLIARIGFMPTCTSPFHAHWMWKFSQLPSL